MRHLKIIVSIVIIGLFSLPSYAGIPQENQRVFDIYRNNKKIGTHTLTFTRKGSDTVVDIDIKMKATLGFIPLYKYRHTNREIWRGDQLLSIDAFTNDNGKKAFVRAYKNGNVLKVTSNNHAYTTSANIMSTSYWHRSTAYQKQLINTQTGKLINVGIVDKKSISTPMGKQIRPSQKYVISGDIKTIVSYDKGTSEWIGLNFKINGADFVYKPVITNQKVVSK